VPTLVYSDVDGVDRSFALGNEPVTIGRAPECSIRSEDPRVSRVHARFFIEAGVLWIEDAGSSNGIYVGPQRVQRAPVPTGEIILVGSLMMRLLPASGTLPPPVGLHGTLATWLEMERKSRIAIEDERDAFARRVGEMHVELAAAKAAAAAPEITIEHGTDPSNDLAEAVRLRDEAIARAAGLERALAAMQDEAQVNREEIDKQRRASVADLEAVRLELAKAREAKMVAETQAGMAVAEKLAETDMVIANLQKDLADAKKLATAPSDKAGELQAQITTLTARAEKAEKDLGAAQIRAQGAERNVTYASSQAAKAETKVAVLESEVKDRESKLAALELKRAEIAERLAQLEARAGAGTKPLEQAEQRAKQLAGDLAEATLQLDTQRDKLAAATTALAEAEAKVAAAETAMARATAEADARIVAAAAAARDEVAKAGDAGKRIAELEAKVKELSQAEVAIKAATASRDAALARAQAAEQKAAETQTKIDEADKRSIAAETMAKAMAKDVAEALRRAAEADARFKAAGREIADSKLRADEAETKAKAIDQAIARAETAEAAAAKASADAEAAIAAARAEAEAQMSQARAAADKSIADAVGTAEATAREAIAAAEARATQTEQELGAKVVDTQQLLAARIEATRKELSAKLEQAQRELAAERATGMSLVDRKTQLERELAGLQTNLPVLAKRAETSEAARAELEVQVEQLKETVVDLESKVAIAETVEQTTNSETKEKTSALEKELASTKAAAQKASELADSLRVKLKLVEGELAGFDKAKARLIELERLADDRATATAEAKTQLQDAQAKLADIEANTEGLRSSAEAADLAIGRASALQRQLDEAISKLSYLERELGAARTGQRGDTEALAGVEQRARDAEQRARDAETRIADSERTIADADRKLADAARKIAEADRKLAEADQQLADSDQKRADADRKLTSAAKRIAELESRPKTPAPVLDTGALDAAHERIADLERELQKADNVRSFAAETEREIAQLQRDLRDARSKLTQITLERDRYESELRDARDADSDTTNRRMAIDERGEARYEGVLAKFTEAEQRLQRAEKDNAALKKHSADLEARLENALERLADQVEATATGNQLPLADMVEHVSVLEESIDSLRSNMRAASDETALMDQTDSVVAVSSAVSQAAEHIERARAAIRALLQTIRV